MSPSPVIVTTSPLSPAAELEFSILITYFAAQNRSSDGSHRRKEKQQRKTDSRNRTLNYQLSMGRARQFTSASTIEHSIRPRLSAAKSVVQCSATRIRLFFHSFSFVKWSRAAEASSFNWNWCARARLLETRIHCTFECSPVAFMSDGCVFASEYLSVVFNLIYHFDDSDEATRADWNWRKYDSIIQIWSSSLVRSSVGLIEFT